MPTSLRFRSLDQMRLEHQLDPVVVHLITLLHEKVATGGRYAMYEYDAHQAGSEDSARVLARAARQDRAQIDELLDALVERVAVLRGLAAEAAG